MWRFEFDNDVFVGSDDGFTAGWSLQRHSALLDRWDDGRLRWSGRTGSWLGSWFPALADDGAGGRLVRSAYGLSQQIFTPAKTSEPQLQPEDVPWAGVLGLHGALASYDNERLTAVQLYLGCMGPCSGAEDLQSFVHDDLELGDPLNGWDNQLDTTWLANLNLTHRTKLVADEPSSYRAGRSAWDLAAGGQIGLGNYWTFAEVQLELRWGLGMPQGFTHIPDPQPRGISLDPVYLEPGRQPDVDTGRFYLSVVGRAAHTWKVAPVAGGDTVNGLYHPGLDDSQALYQILIGAHAGRGPLAIHATYYRYLHDDPLLDGQSGGIRDWVNLSVEYRF